MIYSRKKIPETLRDKFKMKAKELVEQTRAKGEKISLNYALQSLSKKAGFKDWNTCSAILKRVEIEQQKINQFQYLKSEEKNVS